MLGSALSCLHLLVLSIFRSPSQDFFPFYLRPLPLNVAAHSSPSFSTHSLSRTSLRFGKSSTFRTPPSLVIARCAGVSPAGPPLRSSFYLPPLSNSLSRVEYLCLTVFISWTRVYKPMRLASFKARHLWSTFSSFVSVCFRSRPTV